MGQSVLLRISHQKSKLTKNLGIRAQDISTQVLPRDLHADYTIQWIVTSIEHFATEIRHLQRTSSRSEEFLLKVKGQACHANQSISSENVSGLARVIRGHVITGMEDVHYGMNGYL